MALPVIPEVNYNFTYINRTPYTVFYVMGNNFNGCPNNRVK